MEKESALLPVAVLAEWVSGERECSTTSGGAGRVGEWRKRVLYYQWRCWQSG